MLELPGLRSFAGRRKEVTAKIIIPLTQNLRL